MQIIDALAQNYVFSIGLLIIMDLVRIVFF